MVQRLISIPPLTSAANEGFIWPQPDEILQLQKTAAQKRPEDLNLVDSIWKNSECLTWVPDDAENLQLRLCFISHTTAAGHRGCDASEHTLKNISLEHPFIRHLLFRAVLYSLPVNHRWKTRSTLFGSKTTDRNRMSFSSLIILNFVRLLQAKNMSFSFAMTILVITGFSRLQTQTPKMSGTLYWTGVPRSELHLVSYLMARLTFETKLITWPSKASVRIILSLSPIAPEAMELLSNWGVKL